MNHTSYWRFVKYYCDVFWNGFNMTIGALLEGEELAEHLAQYCIRRTKEVLGDQLPSKTVQQVWVDFAPKDQRRYDRMVKEYVVFPHGKDAILALNVISSIMYCKQMAICPDLLWEELDEPLWGPKADAILDILDSLGPKPCVIFTNSAKAATRTSHLLLDHGINSKVLSGETSKYAADIVMGFQRGAYQVLICTILAGGPGITLIAADTAIFIDKHWAPAWNEQAQDRLHRIGQKHPVTIIEILARNTIDERLEEILQARSETAMEMYTDSTQVPTKVAKLLQKALDA